jgi:hypothetical protein
MRIAIFVLLLGCATAAVCQSAAPKLIAHPTPLQLGTQPPGALLAPNESPKRQLLTIEASNPRPKAVPTQWPDFNLHAIPVQWPKFKLVLVQTDAPAAAQPSAK